MHKIIGEAFYIVLDITASTRKWRRSNVMSGMDRYEWYKIDVKDHRHILMYFLENTLAGVKKLKLVIQEMRLKVICRMEFCDNDRFLKNITKILIV